MSGDLGLVTNDRISIKTKHCVPALENDDKIDADGTADENFDEEGLLCVSSETCEAIQQSE